jgi:hypothetical protein
MDSTAPRTLEWVVEPVETGPVVPVTIEPAPESSLAFEIFEAVASDESRHLAPA